jgi:sphingomyelin phosphodiesterase acid-like 3
MNRLILLFSLCLASCSSGPSRAPNSVDSEQILLISDIHFGPFYDSSLVRQLRNVTDGTQWGPIFESSTVTALSQPLHDTNYPLFKSSLAAMKAVIAEPRVILISGDFLRHDFDRATHASGSRDNAQIDPVVQDFAVKTIQFIADSLRKTFPNTQIIPAVGNTDSACDDYEIGPNEVFLKAMATAFAPSSGTPDFVSQFSSAGHFSTSVAGLPNLHLISMNDVYWSTHYVNSCGDATTNPGQS